MQKPQRYIIRHDDGSPMWLTRETPTAWGDRERAKRYWTIGDAMRSAARIKALSKITIEPVG
jgi:hypothetical protein